MSYSHLFLGLGIFILVVSAISLAFVPKLKRLLTNTCLN